MSLHVVSNLIEFFHQGKKRAREDDGVGQAPPDQAAATTTGSPSARKKGELPIFLVCYCLYYAVEYFPRKAKDQVALATPNKLPSVGSRSDAPNPARTTADNGAVFYLTPEIYI